MMGRGDRELRKWLAGLPGLEPGTSSLSGFCTRVCFPRIAPATCTSDVPLETVVNRSAPMACGPNVDQTRPACGRGGAPRRGPWLAKADLSRLPPTSEPRLATALLGGALAGSGPGTSPCRDRLSPVTGMVVPQGPACPRPGYLLRSAD
jgi:hypothetical protein